ncbi:MAG TPA: glycine cleavage system aminomethyltransferase GcvT [Actinomycetota bacterium]|nr:glycine cleavage system aminomethyltransferase GcvT [Actinomycetota bacterium]
MVDALRHSPLEPAHQELGARLGAFGGWLMPIEYEGVLAEHRAVRERVGLFDLSHLGKVDVRGAGGLSALQRTLSNDLAKVEIGRAQYNLVLNERGGVDEDLIVYRLTQDRWFVVPNASNTDRVVARLSEMAGADAVEPHPTWCFLGVQGPRALETVGTRFPEAADLPFMAGAEASFDDTPIVLTRSGYTGELGYELFGPDEIAAALWDELADVGAAFGIEPCGLGARDVLRLEMGYPLYGQDLLPDRTPLEAGVGWAVALDKEVLPGREALLRQRDIGIPSRLRGLVTQGRRHIPRAHQEVQADDQVVGSTTSGTFSPTLGAGIAMAYLAPAERFEPGAAVTIDIRGRAAPATVTRPPFVDRNPR